MYTKTMLQWKRGYFGHISQLEPLVNKEDYKKACLQSVEHHPSTTLSLAEFVWISRYPVVEDIYSNPLERSSS